METDHDTDNDGMADLVKVFMQVPLAAVQGKYKAAVIYDPTPYNAGTVDQYLEDDTILYYQERFDYDLLYKDCAKRVPVGELSTIDQALSQDPSEWYYYVPATGQVGYGYGQEYDYYLIRGFAVAEASGIGTLGSEGFELCGFDLERDAHKCVVEWFTGKRKAYTDRFSDIEIKADWCNGHTAMTGCSYGGTLPYEVATTGVEGLDTIIPYAGIASWYDYTNSQGVAKRTSVNYADQLASFNGGGLFLDDDWLVINDDYGSWLYTVAQDQEATNGRYGDIWERMDYSADYEKIACSALIVQSLNDFNVTTRQAELMYRAFKNAGQKVSLVLHQDGHNTTEGKIINGELWDVTKNRWLCHYLYGIDNGAENQPEVTVQSNIDASFTTYDSWGDFEYRLIPAAYEVPEQTVATEGYATFVNVYSAFADKDGDQDKFLLCIPEENRAMYELEIPEGATISGVPQISFTASTDKEGFEGLMISAALVDVIDGEKVFKAYMTKSAIHDTLPVRTVDLYDYGGNAGKMPIKEFVPSNTPIKAFTYGWTDLANPDGGYESSDYRYNVYLEPGAEHDYTFFMMPTVYTMAPGHRLFLIIYTRDPYTPSFLDQSQGDTESEEFFNYSFKILNDSLRVQLPLAGG